MCYYPKEKPDNNKIYNYGSADRIYKSVGIPPYEWLSYSRTGFDDFFYTREVKMCARYELIDEGFCWYNIFARCYYYTHHEEQRKEKRLMAHRFKHKTQCVTRFYMEFGDPSHFDFTPYPPIIKPLTPNKSDAWRINLFTRETKSEANNGKSKANGFDGHTSEAECNEEGNKYCRWKPPRLEGRTIQPTIDPLILESHAYFTGGVKPKPFTGWFYAEIKKCKARIKKLYEYKEAGWTIDVFDCHYLDVNIALDFETSLLKILQKNKNKYTKTDLRKRQGIMPSESDYFPLNNFTMRSNNPLDGRYINEEFELEQYSRLQENLSVQDRSDKMLKLFEIKGESR